MFKGLKDKLKNALSSFTKSAEQEAEVREEEALDAPEEISEREKELIEEDTTSEKELSSHQDTPQEESEREAELAEKDERSREEESDAPKRVSERGEELAEDTAAEKELSDSQEESEQEADAEEEKPAPVPDEHITTTEPAEKPSVTVQQEKPAKTTEKPPAEQPVAEKKSFFAKIKEKVTTIQLSEEKFEELFWDIELALLESNVAVEVIERIKADLQDELTTGREARGGLKERVERRMRETLTDVLSQTPIDLLESAKQHSPLVICIVGVNGSGKTTSIGKLGAYFTQEGKSVVFAAADTFRAAAIQQLQEHAKNLDIPCIAQSYGADPAAVAYDAIQYATARNIDVVLIDTAGRLHSNTNLMDELAKVVRVAKPHHTLFVGEATTGNDCVEQARLFSEKTRVDGVILTKADVDDKGGAAVSVAYITKKPILFLGVGQDYGDFEHFMPETIVDSLLGE